MAVIKINIGWIKFFVLLFIQFTYDYMVLHLEVSELNIKIPNLILSHRSCLHNSHSPKEFPRDTDNITYNSLYPKKQIRVLQICKYFGTLLARNLIYSWIGSVFQIRLPTPMFLLSMSNFKSETRFRILNKNYKKHVGYFFARSQN